MKRGRQSLTASLLILLIYAAGILAWLIVEGGQALEAALFAALGLPVAALALWWSGQQRPPRS
jgi:hypothetical protein